MIYISLGSNLGDRLAHLRKAVRLLKENYLSELECSIILETEAILPSGALVSWNKPYLNMVVRGNTSLSPFELLEGLKKIEETLGRPKHYEKWAPRIIDLDILLWDDSVINTPNLTLPHPELLNRNFLVHLIAMLDPQAIHSLNGQCFAEIAYKRPNINTCFIKSLTLEPQLVGIVNVTPDSFSDGSIYFEPEKAIGHIAALQMDGASVVDIGAHSTRPGAELVSADEELRRLLLVFEKLQEIKQDAAVSLDSFSPKVIQYLLERFPIDWINIQDPNIDEATLGFIASRNCKIVMMHSMTIPARREKVMAFQTAPITTILQWAETSIERLMKLGFSKERIMLDPGIGFGTTMHQSLALLKEVGQLHSLGCEIMVGHSRKSFMTGFSHLPARDRDIETLAISYQLMQQGVDYLRVHNVAEHQRFFAAAYLIS